MNFILTVLGVAFGGAIILGCLTYLFLLIGIDIAAGKLEEELRKGDKK